MLKISQAKSRLELDARYGMGNRGNRLKSDGNVDYSMLRKMRNVRKMQNIRDTCL